MNKETIEHSVLEKIKRGDVRMRPRIYFIVQTVVIAAVALFALSASVFAVSFALFSVIESGEWFLLGFGARGALIFLALFPWYQFFIALGLIFLLDWLLRFFKWGYRTPLLHLFFGALAVISLTGILVAFTPLHAALLNDADRGELPLFGGLYETIRAPHEAAGEFRGVVLSIQNNLLTITHSDRDTDADDGVHTVAAPSGFDLTRLQVGDRVYVAGTMLNGIIHAFGLQKLP